mmetsp:Transcript_11218/g.19057  ORF Transcript_11218/g.19057 Transcript_11218/m.19057 type:complete len:85 (+) Transcript_11218:82-336(+)
MSQSYCCSLALHTIILNILKHNLYNTFYLIKRKNITFHDYGETQQRGLTKQHEARSVVVGVAVGDHCGQAPRHPSHQPLVPEKK